MAEEENEEQKAADAADAPEEAADAPVEAEAVEAEAPEADAPAEKPPAAPEPTPAAAATAEPEEVLHPKERRRRHRSTHRGEVRPERSNTERSAERDAERKRKAAARTRSRKAQRAKRGAPKQGTPPAERRPGQQRLMQGTVVSSKVNKSITVKVESARRHPSYEKIIRRSRTLQAHDETNDAGEGDVVRVIETRPISKTKRWRLVEILERSR